MENPLNQKYVAKLWTDGVTTMQFNVMKKMKNFSTISEFNEWKKSLHFHCT